MAKENLAIAEREAQDTAIVKRAPAFWLQQAAELAVKAVLVAEDASPPKHHDLDRLRRDCHAVEMRGLGSDSLAELNPWVLGSRYPADLPDFDPDLDRLTAHAKAVVHAAELAVTRIVGTDPEEG
jgi:HEPN domain-containing protein